MEVSEKYKATKLWNGVIRAFRSQMPTRRHRRQLRAFDETFTGVEALDWLHAHLCDSPHLADNKSVSRTQALALLNKFYQQGLFVRARSERKVKEPFAVRDDGTLFKFTDTSPTKVAQTPLALQRQRSVGRAVSVGAADGRAVTPTTSRRARTAVTPLRYRRLITSPPSTDASQSSSTSLVPATSSSSAEATCSDAVTSTSSCLQPASSVPSSSQETLVEEASGASTAPHAASSTTDVEEWPQVHLVVRKLSLDEIANVWRCALVDRLTNVLQLDGSTLDLLRAISFAGDDARWNSENVSRSGIVVARQKDGTLVCLYARARGSPPQTDALPRWVFRAMRCLTRWPFENHLAGHVYAGFERDVFRNVTEFFANNGAPLLPDAFGRLLVATLDRAAFIDVQLWDDSAAFPRSPFQPRPTLTGRFSESTSEVHLETDFCGQLPVTRLLIPTVSSARRSRASMALTTACDGFDSPFRDYFSERRQIVSVVSPSRQIDVNPGALVDPSSSSVVRRPTAVEETLSSLPGLVRSPALMRRLTSANGYATGNRRERVLSSDLAFGARSRYRGSLALFPAGRLPIGARSRSSWAPAAAGGAAFGSLVCTPLSADLSSLSPCSRDFAPSSSGDFDALRGYFTAAGRQKAIESLRLCLLMLPPRTRHWLHYLIRFMNKVSRNHCLKLADQPNRYTMLETFCPLLVSAEGGDVSISQLVKLVAVLMDNEAELFAASADLSKDVAARVGRLQRERVAYERNAPSELQFCERITSRQFEAERSRVSQESLLAGLLDTLLSDENVDERTRKRRLKKFQREYPAVYAAKIPTADVPPPPCKDRVPISNPLRRIKALRI